MTAAEQGDGAADREGLVVASICRRGDSVVLVQRSADDAHLPSRWGLPAGHVRHGESPGEALCREMLEETGLEVVDATLVGRSTFSETVDDARVVAVVQLNYVTACRPSSVAAPDLDEVARSRWVHRSEFDALGLDEFTREVISQADDRWQRS